MQPRYETKRVLIVVRTYPTPARKGVEVSCTAAITEEGKWMRLFPIPYRFLAEDKRFRKYQWIDVDVAKASDARPESYKIRGESIRIISEPLSPANDWKLRKEYVLPLQAHCMCCLQKERDANGHPTLGIFRPRSIDRFVMTAEAPEWSQSQIEILRQADLFEEGPRAELEKVPFSFKYEFHCDESDCKGHAMTCTDWEIGESWRRWKTKYGDQWENKFRQRYEEEMIHKYDTHFYVGTVHQHPSAWIIVGLFYPPRVDYQQPALF
jgi:hypothetical protein